jgi:hypothetical protein
MKAPQSKPLQVLMALILWGKHSSLMRRDLEPTRLGPAVTGVVAEEWADSINRIIIETVDLYHKRDCNRQSFL